MVRRRAHVVVALLAACAFAAVCAQAQTVESPWTIVFQIPGRLDGRWLGDMWSSGTNDVFAVGRRCIVHFDGRAWSITPDHSESAIFDVDGSGQNDVYAVGSLATIQRWDGTRWVLEHQDLSASVRGGAFYSVVVRGPGEAYAFGHAGSLRRLADGTWEEIPADDRPLSWLAVPQPPESPCRADAHAANSAGSLWGARCQGRLWVWEEGNWRDTGLRAPVGRSIDELLVIDPTHELAVLSNGSVYYRAGNVWTRELETRRPQTTGQVPSRTMLRVGNVVYLTADHRIYARRVDGPGAGR
jgi:hypothetical protein